MRKRKASASKNDSEQSKKRRAGQICEMIANAPRLRCRNCSCAQDGCIRARTNLTHLCCTHSKDASTTPKRSHYMSPEGPRRMDEAWSEEVKLIAISGRMLKDMRPSDVEASSVALGELIGSVPRQN